MTDYRAIKAKRRAHEKPTIEDLSAAIDTEKAALVALVLGQAEAEAKEYRLTGIYRYGNPELESVRAAVKAMGGSAYEKRRHLAKLLNMQYELLNPVEAAANAAKMELCADCGDPITAADAVLRVASGAYHQPCLDPKFEEDEESDEDGESPFADDNDE